MARKQIRVSRRMLFTWFMLAGLILLFAEQDFTNKFQLAFAHIFRWPLSIGGNISLTAPARQPLREALDRKGTQYQNYIANLEETVIQQRKKFEKLYGLYNTYVWEGVDFALADVIPAAIDGPRNEITIDCRKNSNLVEGQFVLGDESIIGTICDVLSRTARVKLFTDSTSRIPVKIGIGELKAIMKGCGDNTAKVEMLKRKVKIGENVFALSPGFLDAPMIIGKVSRCETNHKSPLLWDITVEPACDIEKLEDVAVIIMNPKK